MSVQSYVPTLWRKQLLENLNDAHVYKQACVNTDFEGEIEVGSSIKINSVGRITISSHTRNTNITAAEEVDLAGQHLVIDQADHYHFQVDDLDKAQAAGDFLGAANKEAAWGLADTVDVYIAELMQAGAALSVTAATVGTGAGEKSLYDKLVEMDVALTETNTPRSDRFVVVPPWGEGMLRLDERFIGFGTDKNRVNLRGEPIGQASGFMVYMSNNVPRDSSEYSILAGYKGATTFAQQVKTMETYRPELRFADAFKGMIVFGGKVLRPSNLIRFDATKGTFTS